MVDEEDEEEDEEETIGWTGPEALSLGLAMSAGTPMSL